MNTQPFINTFILITLVLFPAASFAGVTTDHDADADFSQACTYSWGDGIPVDNPLMEQRVREAVDAKLQKLGYEEVEENADLIVSTRAMAYREQQLIVDEDPFFNHRRPYRWHRYSTWHRYGASPVTITPVEVTRATLEVEIADSDTDEVIWIGTATGSPRKSPEKNAAKVQKITAKMFASYPLAH